MNSELSEKTLGHFIYSHDRFSMSYHGAPALVIGGSIGFLGIPLDSSTVIFMPMILGLAVYDIIHLINHAKVEFLRTGRYRIRLIRRVPV
jgi:hypothetical protein